MAMKKQWYNSSSIPGTQISFPMSWIGPNLIVTPNSLRGCSTRRTMFSMSTSPASLRPGTQTSRSSPAASGTSSCWTARTSSWALLTLSASREQVSWGQIKDFFGVVNSVLSNDHTGILSRCVRRSLSWLDSDWIPAFMLKTIPSVIMETIGIIVYRNIHVYVPR